MGTLRIARVESLADEEWDAAFEASPTAVWSQARAWADVWSEYTRGALRTSGRAVVFSDGVRVCVPMSDQRGRFGRRVGWQLSAGGAPGGWFSHAGVGKAHVVLLVEWLRSRSNLTWRINPFDDLACDVAGIHDEAGDPTWWLPLGEGFEAVRRGFSRSHRAAARRAKREGVSIEAGCSDADWAGYLEAYADTAARWGSRARVLYPPRFFAILRARHCGSLRFWVARHEARVVAGALVFEAAGSQSYWHGAMRRDAPRGVMPLLMETVIENACREGVEVFDFHPSGGNAGVATFKERFGATPHPCPLLRTKPQRFSARLLARWSRR